MKSLWKTEWPDWALLLVTFGLAAWRWTLTGNTVPVHWNAAGRVDRTGGKLEGVLALPLLSLGLYAFFAVLPRLDPGRANYAQFASSYRMLRRGVLAMNLVLYDATLLWAAGYQFDMGRVVSVALGVLFLLLGGVMGKIRPNWFVGIRTPWTLSSKTAWVRTHRVGGWAFLALGAVQIVAAAVLPPASAIPALQVLLIGTALGLAAYSYFVWRGASDKMPPANTTPAEEGA